MSYRCELCSTAVPSGRPALRHVVQRDDGSTLRELKVCRRCQEQLAQGTDPADLIPQAAAPTPPATPPTPVPQRVTLGRPQ